MFKRVAKLFLGIISFPICIAVSISLYEQLIHAKILSYNQKYFIFGIIAYLITHVAFFKPEYLYILGHELMHVIATWISRGRVTSFKVSSSGGAVTTTKSNFFIALAPYFFPFYTVVVAVVFFVIALVIKRELPYSSLLFLVGFTLTFHIILTIDFLKTKQSDFLHAGYLLSICLVYVVNLIVIVLICSLFFGEVDFMEFLKSIYFQSKDIYLAVFRQLFL